MTQKLIAALWVLGCAFLDFSAHASSGTGFAVADGAFVITNFHVVKGCTTVNIVNFGHGVVKTTDPRIDVAIIVPERPVPASLRIRSSYSQLKLGEEIIVIGFPLKGLLSSTPIVTTGIVSSLAGIQDDPTRLQITAPIQPGNSGGPVLDRSGNVVGIAVSKLNALKIAPLIGDIPQNVNFAIASSSVAPFLDQYSVKYKSGAFDRVRPISEIVSDASDAVVSIECVVGEALRPSTVVPANPGPISPPPLPLPGGYGAIAWDRDTGKYGVSWNQPTGTRAEEVALGECGASGCNVVGRVGPRMCGALATTEDGKHAGAAWRKDREAARLDALKSCGKDQARECVVRATDCNK
jgi:hypothetical protein